MARGTFRGTYWVGKKSITNWEESIPLSQLSCNGIGDLPITIRTPLLSRPLLEVLEADSSKTFSCIWIGYWTYQKPCQSISNHNCFVYMKSSNRILVTQVILHTSIFKMFLWKLLKEACLKNICCSTFHWSHEGRDKIAFLLLLLLYLLLLSPQAHIWRNIHSVS